MKRSAQHADESESSKKLRRSREETSFTATAVVDARQDNRQEDAPPRPSPVAAATAASLTTIPAPMTASFAGAGAGASPSAEEYTEKQSHELNVDRFPEKIMWLLDNRTAPDGLWWLPSGDAFAIKKIAFIDQLLHSHFRGNKFSSITRKLNRWGFRRIEEERVPREVMGYSHKHFRRGFPALLRHMEKEEDRKRPAMGSPPVDASANGETKLESDSPSAQIQTNALRSLRTLREQAMLAQNVQFIPFAGRLGPSTARSSELADLLTQFRSPRSPFLGHFSDSTLPADDAELMLPAQAVLGQYQQLATNSISTGEALAADPAASRWTESNRLALLLRQAQGQETVVPVSSPNPTADHQQSRRFLQNNTLAHLNVPSLSSAIASLPREQPQLQHRPDRVTESAIISDFLNNRINSSIHSSPSRWLASPTMTSTWTGTRGTSTAESTNQSVQTLLMQQQIERVQRNDILLQELMLNRQQQDELEQQRQRQQQGMQQIVQRQEIRHQHQLPIWEPLASASRVADGRSRNLLLDGHPNLGLSIADQLFLFQHRRQQQQQQQYSQQYQYQQQYDRNM